MPKFYIKIKRKSKDNKKERKIQYKCIKKNTIDLIQLIQDY